jgi:hypothetical protein
MNGAYKVYLYSYLNPINPMDNKITALQYYETIVLKLKKSNRSNYFVATLLCMPIFDNIIANSMYSWHDFYVASF